MEAENNKKKRITKKGLIISLAVIIVLISAIGITGFLFLKNKKAASDMPSPPEMSGMGEDVISASGLTLAGMLEETWELDFLETALYVEESYLATGDTVESGTAVFKVSEDSLKEARKELENKLTEADLAYRQGVIDYETDAVDARVTGDTATVNRNYAQAEYDSAATKAAQTVKNLEQQREEAAALVDEYTKSETEDYYRTYYKVDELYQTYYEHFTLLMEYYEKWNIEELEDLYGNVSAVTIGTSQSTAGGLSQGQEISQSTTEEIPQGQEISRSAAGEVSQEQEASQRQGSSSGQGGDSPGQGGDSPGQKNDSPEAGGDLPEQSGMEGMSNGSLSGGNANMGSHYSEDETKLAVYNAFDEMVKEEADAYTTALENYESAKEQAAAGLDQAVSNLATLEAELVQAKADYESTLILSRAEYETTLAESDNAESVYETTMQSLEETLAGLKDDKEEAEENLALFEEVIGDGYFYTGHAGTIVMNGVRRETYLSGEAIILAYSNPEKVTISANVDQSNIAQISVGDSVYVVVNEYGNYTGKVTEINPVTQAQSRSSVTYEVQVILEGDVSALESNLTAYLYFGMTDEMIREMQGGSAERGKSGGKDREQMPEGMDRENMPEMPEGMDMENMPEMPEGMDMENMPEMPEGMNMESMPGDRGGNPGGDRQRGASE